MKADWQTGEPIHRPMRCLARIRYPNGITQIQEVWWSQRWGSSKWRWETDYEVLQWAYLQDPYARTEVC